MHKFRNRPTKKNKEDKRMNNTETDKRCPSCGKKIVEPYDLTYDHKLDEIVCRYSLDVANLFGAKAVCYALQSGCNYLASNNPGKEGNPCNDAWYNECVEGLGNYKLTPDDISAYCKTPVVRRFWGCIPPPDFGPYTKASIGSLTPTEREELLNRKKKEGGPVSPCPRTPLPNHKKEIADLVKKGYVQHTEYLRWDDCVPQSDWDNMTGNNQEIKLSLGYFPCDYKYGVHHGKIPPWVACLGDDGKKPPCYLLNWPTDTDKPPEDPSEDESWKREINEILRQAREGKK
jgi:hypothetical protein